MLPLTHASRLAAAVLFLPFAAASVSAQTAPASPALDDLLVQLESAPEDFELLWLVATQATIDGRYDEAISALERLLIYFPQDPSVRIELGVMYFRLGAYDYANRQFELAQSLDIGLTVDQTARIESFEAPIKRGISGVERSTGLTASWAYVDNPSSRSRADSVYLFSELVSTPESEGYNRAALSFNHSHQMASDDASGTMTTLRFGADAGVGQFGEFAELTISDYDIVDFTVTGEVDWLIPLGIDFEGLGLQALISGDFGQTLNDTQRTTTGGLSGYIGIRKATADTEINMGLRLQGERSWTEQDITLDDPAISLPTRMVTAAEADIVQRLNKDLTLDSKAYLGMQTGMSAPGTILAGGHTGLTLVQQSSGGSLSTTRVQGLLDVSMAEAPDPYITDAKSLSTAKIGLSLTQTWELSGNASLIISGQAWRQDSNLPNGRISDWSVSTSLPFRF